MKKLMCAFSLFAAVIIFMGAYFTLHDSKDTDSRSDEIIALNEIEHLCEKEDTETAGEKAAALKASLNNEPSENGNYITMTLVCLLFLTGVSVYCYAVIIRPFDKLKDFAERISQGDFDIPLDYERTDYFGKFTWAFDNMRREITKARIMEKEAVENNKTIIASLSHDIKTPVASIRAYAEALEAGMDTSAEKRARYIGVIMRKCDEVTKLTNDMLLHSLSDMEKLRIEPETFELGEFTENVIRDISAEEDIRYVRPAFNAMVSADKDRTAQIIENLIVNARKYGKSPIEITLTANEKFATMRFRDYGNGIPDCDMPFVTEKFYRGHNSSREQGSGLGLYIVNYIAVRSGGELTFRNLPDGFEACVSLPLSNTAHSS